MIVLMLKKHKKALKTQQNEILTHSISEDTEKNLSCASIMSYTSKFTTQ